MSVHGGGIAVESEPGVGSTFRVFFPVSSQAATVAVPGVPVPLGRGQHVLVVDDESSVGTFTGVRLEQLNYRVLVFDDPRRALAAVRANPRTVDALVTDYMMPGLTGLDLIREIRALGSAAPAVLITGNRGQVSGELLGQTQNVSLLDKPFSGDDIARALHAAFAGEPSPPPSMP